LVNYNKKYPNINLNTLKLQQKRRMDDILTFLQSQWFFHNNNTAIHKLQYKIFPGKYDVYNIFILHFFLSFLKLILTFNKLLFNMGFCALEMLITIVQSVWKEFLNEKFSVKNLYYILHIHLTYIRNVYNLWSLWVIWSGRRMDFIKLLKIKFIKISGEKDKIKKKRRG